MNNENSIVCKIVLLGESGVGKTSIIDRYFKDDFMMDIAPSRAAFFHQKWFQWRVINLLNLKYGIYPEMKLVNV